MALFELDVLDEMRELTPEEIFGGWLQELLVAFSPFIEPAFAWLLEGLEIAISVKLDDLEKTFMISESGIKIEEGLREDALMTMFMSEEGFLSVIRGERKMVIPPPGDEPLDSTEFPEMVREYVEALKGIEAVLKVKLEDPEVGDFNATMKLAGPMKDEPDVEIAVAQDVLNDMAMGALDPAQAFLLGNALQIEGDVDLMMKLALMMM